MLLGLAVSCRLAQILQMLPPDRQLRRRDAAARSVRLLSSALLIAVYPEQVPLLQSADSRLLACSMRSDDECLLTGARKARRRTGRVSSQLGCEAIAQRRKDVLAGVEEALCRRAE
jgi:hypothetical protein